MKCPHCSVSIHAAWISGDIVHSGVGIDEVKWGWEQMQCPDCHETIVRVGWYYFKHSSDLGGWGFVCDDYMFVYPRSTRREPIGPGVPWELLSDYQEACDVLSISAKASAALSRRVLQSILDQQGYTGRNLATQIDNLLNETDSNKALPSSLKRTVDAIRNFGNFSAHPVTDVTSLQIIDVEPQECEWCLGIVEQLFDHYYVRPTADAKRLVDLNAKLAQAGKPSAKG